VRRILFVCLLALAIAIPAAPAFASATTSGYAPSGGREQLQVQTSHDPGRSLPFTGLDVGLLFVGGAALVLTGMGLTRVLRRIPS